MLTAGLVSISFRSNSPAEIIAAAKAAGLSAIEWGSDVHAPWEQTARLQEIAAMQMAAGITTCTYGTYFRIGVNQAEEIRGYIAGAKILGTDILRVWCGDKSSMDYSDAEAENILAESRKVASIAKEAGVKLCLEFHPHTYSDELKSALALMQAVNSPAFRMYWQPNQYRTAAENAVSAAGLAPYVENIHVFNWDGNDRYPLAGSVDTWREYFSCFTATPLCMLEFMPDDDIRSLTVEAQTLREILHTGV